MNLRPTWNITGSPSTSAKQASVKDRVASLFGPIRHSLTEDYIDASGKTFGINSIPRWREPLKGKVLIVDIDTREPNGNNEMLNPNVLNWERLVMSGGQLVSGAIMGHYLYCESFSNQQSQAMLTDANKPRYTVMTTNFSKRIAWKGTTTLGSCPVQCDS